MDGSEANETGLLVTFLVGGVSIGIGFSAALDSPVWGLAIGAFCTAAFFVLYLRFPKAASDLFLHMRRLLRKDRMGATEKPTPNHMRRPSRLRLTILIGVSVLVGVAATAGGFLGLSGTSPQLAPRELAAAPGVTVKSPRGLTAELRIANVTRGDTVYSKQTTAIVDDVLKVEVGYGNTSSTNTIADVSANFNLPIKAASRVAISSDLYGSGAVLRPSVVLSVDVPNARLSFIPNSVVWKFNQSGTDQIVEQSLPDTVLLGSPRPLENLHPGDSGSITILLRVVADVIGVTSTCAQPGSDVFSSYIDAKSGESIECHMTITNYGNEAVETLEAYDNIPAHTTFKISTLSILLAGNRLQTPPGFFVDPRSPTGVGRTQSDSPALQLGSLPVGSSITIEFSVVILPSAMGQPPLKNISVATAAGLNEIYNVAHINVAET
jgi:hypothetical protein